MKILHTSDLHLGKNLLEESLLEEQKNMLEQILTIIKNEEINILIIAGDIYDKTIPSSDAINLFNNFLIELSKINIEVLITSGNHDSKDRLSYGSKIFDKHNIHIVTTYENKITKYEYNNVVFYMLPFLKPFHIKKYMEEEEQEKITTSNQMMKWILNREKIDKTKKNFLIAHQFVINESKEPTLSESESGTNVGTLDAIDANIYDDFDYVALGHIHRPQKIKRETIRYSGTPLKYSFSESNDKKSVVIIDTDDMNIKLIPIKPIRDLEIIKGSFEEILKLPNNNNLLKFELTDDIPIISPMNELRKKFPNALSLTFTNRKIINDDNSITEINVKEESPYELFNKFYSIQNNKELTNEEGKYIKEIIEEVKGGE